MSKQAKEKRQTAPRDNGIPDEPLTLVPPPTLIRLDLGCGPNPREGFEGVDRLPFGGKVKHVVDLCGEWPWADNSVEETHASHVVEHFTAIERVHFFNELHRVLIPGGKCTMITPHWCSNRAYGDFTHQWPPVSEMFFYYLSREWRKAQAPHTDIEHNPNGYSCDWEAVWGYSMHQDLMVRSQEYQQHALQFWKEAASDLIATLTCRK